MKKLFAILFLGLALLIWAVSPVFAGLSIEITNAEIQEVTLRVNLEYQATPNDPVQYYHTVEIQYFLFDSDGNKISEDYRLHQFPYAEAKDEIGAIYSKFPLMLPAVWGWIRQDKIELAGQDIGEVPQ